MHVKTCGEEDAVSDVNGPVGERSNEELVPAWVGVAKVGDRGQAVGLQVQSRTQRVGRSANWAP